MSILNYSLFGFVRQNVPPFHQDNVVHYWKWLGLNCICARIKLKMETATLDSSTIEKMSLSMIPLPAVSTASEPMELITSDYPLADKSLETMSPW